MLALQQGQFTAHLQPIVDLRHGRTLGFEALARWITTDGKVLSPKHFLNVTRADGLTAVLDLQVELVEETLGNAETGLDDLLRELTDRHVLVAIDDFGTGYSSLSRLHDLAVNTIKVDRSFVQRINATNKSSNQLLDMLVAVGHDLGITLTAEGVETEQQRCWLLEHGIERGQGYLFSRPLCLDAAIASLSATS